MDSREREPFSVRSRSILMMCFRPGHLSYIPSCSSSVVSIMEQVLFSCLPCPFSSGRTCAVFAQKTVLPIFPQCASMRWKCLKSKTTKSVLSEDARNVAVILTIYSRFLRKVKSHAPALFILPRKTVEPCILSQ